MTKSSMLSEALEGFANGLGQLAKEAAADIGNTYQAVLTQDTGWGIQNSITEMTQERAQDISKGMVEAANSPALEAEREM